MHHDSDILDGERTGDAATSQGGDPHGAILPGSLVQAGTHHADELGDAHQAGQSISPAVTATDDLACIGDGRHPGAVAERGMAPLGADPGDPEALLPGMRGNGKRCWKVDLCRLLNTVAGTKVIDDRQLRRHSARGGHRFVDGRFVHIAKYIAWLADEVHAPRPMKALSNAKGTVTVHGILHVVARQGHRCALTGRSLAPEDASLDHIMPISRDGKHTLTNIQILHRDVNRAKSTMTNNEFVTLCREVVAWADRSTSN